MLPKNIVPNLLEKRTLLKNLFLFAFLKWILKHLFKINVKLINYCNNCNQRYIKLSQTSGISTKCSNCKKNIVSNRNIILIIYKDNKVVFSSVKKDFNPYSISLINIVLSKYLNIYINNYYNKFSYLSSTDKVLSEDNKSITNIPFKNVINSYKLIKLFNIYKNLKYRSFISKFLVKELKIINTLSNLQFNKFKYVDFTSQIKSFVKTLYNKNIELNLVNMKYLHLDSDMFLDSLAVKLRKKKSALFRVLRKSLKLVKRPKVFSSLLEKVGKNSLTAKSRLYNETNYKKIHSVINTNNTFSKNILYFDTKTNILNNLKYKWIAGIRLEAKGRLTRRYTASRALFKYINRGNLKNLDYLYIPSYEIEPVSVYRIRNQFKPNLQYTYKYGNKRIGTFGLKGWINSV